MRTFSSVGMRPARRSATSPSLTVAKLPRATRSFRPTSTPGAQGLEDAPAELVLERIVAEEGQVGRPAARRDAHHDRIGDAADGAFRQRVEVRLAGRLELAPAVGGQAADPVHDQQDDLRIRLLAQLAGQVFPFHGRSLLRKIGCILAHPPPLAAPVPLC